MRAEKTRAAGDEDTLAFVEMLGKRRIHNPLPLFGTVAKLGAIAKRIPERLFYVARIVLDIGRRLQIRCDFLDALDRSNSLRSQLGARRERFDLGPIIDRVRNLSC